ncbi:hypothetical protein Tco_0848120 [Tanacetum coccineum]
MIARDDHSYFFLAELLEAEELTSITLCYKLRRPSTFKIPFYLTPFPVWGVFKFYCPFPLSLSSRRPFKLGGVIKVNAKVVMGGNSLGHGPTDGATDYANMDRSGFDRDRRVLGVNAQLPSLV